MTTFLTSDWHIGHRNMATRRGFDSVEEHDESIFDNFRNTVTDNDLVYILGDVTMTGSKTRLHEVLCNVADLPGDKRLVTGNHDAIWPGNRKFHKYNGMYDEAFNSVAPFGRVKFNQSDYLLSHFPYKGDSGDEERFNQFRLRDDGMVLLHGHTHSERRLSSSHYNSIQIHVGVDAWHLYPVTLKHVDYLVNG